jgi:hypothetical protein
LVVVVAPQVRSVREAVVVLRVWVAASGRPGRRMPYRQ